MRTWGIVCAVLSLLVTTGCTTAPEDTRDKMTLTASGYGKDVQAAEAAARTNVREQMKEKGLDQYEIVEAKQVGVEETDRTVQREDGSAISIRGFAAQVEFSLLGPEPEPEPEAKQEEPEEKEAPAEPERLPDWVLDIP